MDTDWSNMNHASRAPIVEPVQLQQPTTQARMEEIKREADATRLRLDMHDANAIITKLAGCVIGPVDSRMTVGNLMQLAVDTITAQRAEIDRVTKIATNANADANMYSNAWQRELAEFDGTIRNNIDAMVVTTQDLVQRNRRVRDALRAKLAAPEFGLYCFTRAELEGLIA